MLDKILKVRTENNWGSRKLCKHFNISRYKCDVIIDLLRKKGIEYFEGKSLEDLFPMEKIHEDYQIKRSMYLEGVVDKKNKELVDLQKKFNLVKTQLDEMHARFDVVANVSDSLVSRTVKVTPTDLPVTKVNAVPFLIASDWHVEEDVDPETINGLNTYNPDVARRRSVNFFRNGATLIQLSQEMYHIDTVVLGVLGDMITGYIHDELVESNHMSPTEAILLVSEFLREGISSLKQMTGINNIIVPCCFGNHGRTEKQKKVSTSYKNSYEWLLYKTLQQHYKDDPTVSVIVENGYHVYLDIFDKYVVRFHHGDQMRYMGGVGGLTIPVNKAISQWNKVRPAYLDVFGHFHQLRDNGNWVSNGSLIGYNAYALSIKADYEIPRQAFFVIDEVRGKTLFCPIYVDDELGF